MRRRGETGGDPGGALIRTLRALVLATAGLALAACGDAPAAREAPPADSSVAIADASGRVVRLEHPPGHVVSLIPAVTRLIVELGAGDLLVGRTDYDTLAAVHALPSVGGGLQPDLERLLVLEPDLVFRFEGDQDRVTGPALDQRGVPNVGLRTDRIEDVRRIARDVGRVLGREAAADSLVRSIDAELADVRAKVAGAERKNVAYVLGGTPPWVAGPNTFIADLLDVAGADNAFADLGVFYAPVSLEELVARDIDAFVVGKGTVVNPRLADRAPLIEVSAEVEAPSTGLGRSALELARALHPDRFR